jgi:predicted Zn-dependent protease
VLLSAQALIRAAQAAQAVGDLRVWLVDHPRDTAAWRLLSQAHAALGNQVAAVRAEGEISALEQDATAALDRMRAAQDLARAGKWGPKGPDYVEASILDTRTRELGVLARQQALER